MDIGVGHYDAAPPETVDRGVIESLRAEDRIRFANILGAWIEVEDGRIVTAGYDGHAVVGSTTIKLGPTSVSVPAVSYPTIQSEPLVTEQSVRFVQTAGGRTGAPLPRRIARPPFLRLTAPTAWTTLALTVDVDGTSKSEVVGASPFPRHWIYDTDGVLTGKSGVIDFTTWTKDHDLDHSPWGDMEAAALISEVETETERQLSRILMGDGKPEIKRLRPGEVLIEQGSAATDVFLILDGMLEVTVDSDTVAEVGPGAVVGERAVLEGGIRTSTLTATTPACVARVDGSALPQKALADVAQHHRREELK